MAEEYLFSLKNPHKDKGPGRLMAVPCDDAEYLADLNAEIFGIEYDEAYDFITSSLDDETKGFIIAFRPSDPEKEQELDVVGMFVLYTGLTTACMAGFGILEDFRGMGMSSDCIDLIRTLVPENIDRLTAQTSSDNAAACALYKSCGFKITETV